MEKYLGIDLVVVEAENLEDFEKEASVFLESYKNFIFTTRKENLKNRYLTPIDSLKKLVESSYEINLLEKDTIILVSNNEVLKELFEEEQDVDKEVFVLLNEEGIVIDFNR